jgi:hypothetical protein
MKTTLQDEPCSLDDVAVWVEGSKPIEAETTVSPHPRCRAPLSDFGEGLWTFEGRTRAADTIVTDPGLALTLALSPRGEGINRGGRRVA